MLCVMQAIFSCVYGEGTTVRLKQAGMEFAVWVFKHASDEQLLPAAPKILDALLSLLDEGRPEPKLLIQSFAISVP